MTLNEKIYVVRTEADNVGKNTRILGYASGTPEDIKAFFDDRKYLSISLTEEDLISVTPEVIRERTEQKERVLQLKKELGELERKLGQK